MDISFKNNSDNDFITENDFLYSGTLDKKEKQENFLEVTNPKKENLITFDLKGKKIKIRLFKGSLSGGEGAYDTKYYKVKKISGLRIRYEKRKGGKKVKSIYLKMKWRETWEPISSCRCWNKFRKFLKKKNLIKNEI